MKQDYSMKQDYNKLRHNLRQWLLGKEYHIALAAMELGLLHHTGYRKDGVTPEFQHQLSQATYARTLDGMLMFQEETLATIFLHDVVEDCEITHSEVHEYLRAKGATYEQLELISSGIEKMTNQYGDGWVAGQKSPKKSKDDYYSQMISCPVASICKGMDRMHNHQSMIGVFTPEKQRDYIKETEEYIIPMLKSARKEWTRQEAAYTNVKHILQVQMEFVDVLHPAEQDYTVSFPSPPPNINEPGPEEPPKPPIRKMGKPSIPPSDRSFSEETRTSDAWNQHPDFNHITVLDADGWDRINWEYSWFEEMITKAEFEARVNESTISIKGAALK